MPFLVSKTVAVVATSIAVAAAPVSEPTHTDRSKVIQSVFIATNPIRFFQPCIPDHMRHPNAPPREGCK